MTKILVLKLGTSERGIPFTDREALLERAKGSWRISVQKIRGVKRAILLYNGTVLEEYNIGDEVLANLADNKCRLTFDLTIVEDSNLRGKQIVYPTANPASVAVLEELEFAGK